MLLTISSSPPARYIPIPAGTMVEGTVPRKPPTRPPHFSIATVTAVATRPASSAERRMEDASIKSILILNARHQSFNCATWPLVNRFTVLEHYVEWNE